MGTIDQTPENGTTPDQHLYNDVTNKVKSILRFVDSSFNNLVIRKEPGYGIKVDRANPQFGWHDLLGPIHVDQNTGGVRPTWATYRNGLMAWAFAVNDQVFCEFHLPHDYAPGTDLFIHAHWSHNSAAVTSGNVTWKFDASYAKGHNQASFSSPITVGSATTAPTQQYRHMITEFQLSSVGGSNGLLDTNIIEVDGMLMCRVYLSANTMTGGAEPFLHYVDVHYQSTGVTTKNKAPDFYI